MWAKILLAPRIMLTAIGLVIFTSVLTPPIILSALFKSSGGPAFRIMRWWAILISFLMGLKYSIYGTENIRSGQSYIITPNHQGNADILALVVNLPLRFRWVIKRELLRIPVFGWALAGTGAIAIDRSDREKAVESLNKAKDKLSKGWSMLIYPEGTRTADGNLLPFKKGPFMIAVQTGLPILPVASNGAFKILPKKTIAFRPGRITLTVGEPIITKDLTENDVPWLMEQTRMAIAKNLKANYDPFKE
ncbi:MAG: 1-acyl-sn-glycerol-3-phosphate acyltransferase [Deltaproteobacteria bacterium]|nr:1-acyl-sn-glycerol-3-phosphate acyltransferase [Deltaproteobacteria bacterium]